MAELAALGAGGLFLWTDYKRGFVTSRALLSGCGDYAKRLMGMLDQVEEADRMIQHDAQRIALLGEQIGSLEADVEQYQTWTTEQNAIAADCEAYKIELLRKGDKAGARVAAASKVNADKRAKLFEDTAAERIQQIQMLEPVLDQAQAEFEVRKTDTETVKVEAKLAAANKTAYDTLSEVCAETGFTPKGDLKKLVATTQHDRIKWQKMLGRMRWRTGDDFLRHSRYEEEITRELEEGLQKIALPEATGNGSYHDIPSDS